MLFGNKSSEELMEKLEKISESMYKKILSDQIEIQKYTFS